MTPLSMRLLATTALFCGLAAPLSAEQLIADGLDVSDTSDLSADLFVADVSVLDGPVCMGNSCMETETFDVDTALKIHATLPSIEFQDSTTTTGYAVRDWRLHVNGNGSGAPERMAFEDLTEGTFPFTVMGGTPSNALFVASTGHVGMGTSLPETELHIIGPSSPTLRLHQDTSGGGANQSWDLVVSSSEWRLTDNNDGISYPFRVANTNASNTLVLSGDHVGVGTLAPLAGLHVQRETAEHVALLVEDETTDAFLGIAPRAFVHVRSTDGVAAMLIEEVNATANPRTLLNLTNNGRPEIVMANTATDGEWSFGAGTDFFLKVGTVGSASGAKNKVFTVKNNGDAIVFGTLTTGGTTCGGGCDLVFSEDYDLPSITEHRDRMMALGYLPNVGPTVEGEPFNLTDKLGRMLNELEHAHIYIAELEAGNRSLRARSEASDARHQAELDALRATQTALLARLDALEARD